MGTHVPCHVPRHGLVQQDPRGSPAASLRVQRSRASCVCHHHGAPPLEAPRHLRRQFQQGDRGPPGCYPGPGHPQADRPPGRHQVQRRWPHQPLALLGEPRALVQRRRQVPLVGPLADQVQKDFGGLDGLKKAVNAAALGIQGSGWAWLGYNPTSKKLEAVATANQDPLLGYVPLVGIDMWEHAFYLDYKNVKQSYLDAIWNVINWETAAERFSKA